MHENPFGIHEGRIGDSQTRRTERRKKPAEGKTDGKGRTPLAARWDRKFDKDSGAIPAIARLF